MQHENKSMSGIFLMSVSFRVRTYFWCPEFFWCPQIFVVRVRARACIHVAHVCLCSCCVRALVFMLRTCAYVRVLLFGAYFYFFQFYIFGI